jgi:hypothetical protein
MRPEDAAALLLSKDWPPKVDGQWPRKVDKSRGERWPEGMLLQGIIEAVFTLPHPQNSPEAGKPYQAMYVRRLRQVDGQRSWGPDGARILWHGWHTAATDVLAMNPMPGLMFTAAFRGYGAKDFVNIKHLVTGYGGPLYDWMDEALRSQIERPGRQPQSAVQQTRQAGGRPTEAPPSRAPEGEATSPASPSGSNGQITSVPEARAYVQAQPPQWQERFRQILGEARASGGVGERLSLDEIRTLIVRTNASMAGEAA